MPLARRLSDVEHVAVGQDSDANLIKKVQYALSNPAKILNLIRLRQRKEAMRDVRSLLAKALDVARATQVSGASPRTSHCAHRQRLLLLAVGEGCWIQLRRLG